MDMTILYIVLAIVVILIIWAILSYNGFVTLTQRVKEALALLEVRTLDHILGGFGSVTTDTNCPEIQPILP